MSRSCSSCAILGAHERSEEISCRYSDAGGEHENVTVAVSVPYNKGVVVAADSRTIAGKYTYTDETRKIYVAGKSALLTVCGNPFVNAAVGERLEAEVEAEADFDAARRALGRVAREEAASTDLQVSCEFLLSGFADAKPQLWISSNETRFSPKPWTHIPYAAVCERFVSYAILKNAYCRELPLPRAELLAALCVVTVASVSRSVGLPLQMGLVDCDGARLLQSEEAVRLADMASRLDWSCLLAEHLNQGSAC